MAGAFVIIATLPGRATGCSLCLTTYVCIGRPHWTNPRNQRKNNWDTADKGWFTFVTFPPSPLKEERQTPAEPGGVDADENSDSGWNTVGCYKVLAHVHDQPSWYFQNWKQLKNIQNNMFFTDQPSFMTVTCTISSSDWHTICWQCSYVDTYVYPNIHCPPYSHGHIPTKDHEGWSFCLNLSDTT